MTGEELKSLISELEEKISYSFQHEKMHRELGNTGQVSLAQKYQRELKEQLNRYSEALTKVNGKQN